ncbi:ParB/RepB/Spo0J family partition protein [Helicobacter brantae]|uniref:Chromosome partitioning protein ParB n=1 Tax=Helicobacter brantae TaxID=375927 RepID=A0A3D8J1T5_9HELI|nr:ParB/RepB/Spo0J family partition protein [Helicobacter brantae]RDU71166.1 chromosome partitioning protein ParB [Helicobacter brantae]
MAKHKKMALGRGLGEILGEVKEAYENNMYDSENQSVVEIAISEIIPNPYQPRKHFREESLNELAQSIKEYGLLQPILVYREDKHYVLIAGERRLKASKILESEKIKAIIADIDLNQLREVALIENIQREDLNPIDLANAYNELIQIHHLTHDELAQKVQKSRSQITNTLRLLQLNSEIQEMLIQEKLTQGHAKILIGLDDENQRKIAKSIVGQKLSVRDTELMVKKLKSPQTPKEKTKETFEGREIEDLRGKLAKLDFSFALNKTKLTIHFRNESDIKKVLDFFK